MSIALKSLFFIFAVSTSSFAQNTTDFSKFKGSWSLSSSSGKRPEYCAQKISILTTEQGMQVLYVYKVSANDNKYSVDSVNKNNPVDIVGDGIIFRSTLTDSADNFVETTQKVAKLEKGQTDAKESQFKPSGIRRLEISEDKVLTQKYFKSGTKRHRKNPESICLYKK